MQNFDYCITEIFEKINDNINFCEEPDIEVQEFVVVVDLRQEALSINT